MATKNDAHSGMKLRNGVYFLIEALKSLFRNGMMSVASVSIVAVSMLTIRRSGQN